MTIDLRWRGEEVNGERARPQSHGEHGEETVNNRQGDIAKVFVVALLQLVGGVICAGASAQCVGGRCPIVSRQQVAERPPASVCRVRVGTATGVQFGSGTLVAAEGAFGYVLTCQHLFREQAQRVAVRFGDGRGYDARVLAVDTRHDLALSQIANPGVRPMTVNAVTPSGLLTAGGFGGSGMYRSVRGTVVGAAMPQGAQSASIQIQGAVRSGDSGGPVFSPAGKLVGVVWGMQDGLTYATIGKPLQQIMARVPTGKSRPPPTGGMVALRSRKPAKQSPTENSLTPRVAALEKKVGEWKPCQCPEIDTTQFATRQDLTQLVRREQWQAETTSQRLAMGVLSERISKRVRTFNTVQVLAGAVGIGSPIGIAILTAGVLARRRSRRNRTPSVAGRGLGGPREEPFHPAAD